MMDSEYLPYDVLLEILHRLPVKSLIRFRCVSKSWNSLITSSAFINSNLTRSHSDSNKLIVRYLDVTAHVERYKLIHEDNDNNVFSSEQIQDLKLPLRSRLCSYFQLVGSANGLFCLYDENRFILWNPCIRKFITLPNPSVTVPITCHKAFGFDSRTNDYKVVRIAYQCENIRYEGAKPPLVEVYSVSERCWRITSGGDSFPPGIAIRYWHPEAASLNGAVYFVANDWGNKSSKVLSFNLGDEVFRMISLPNGKFGLYANIFTSVFKGLLSLICYEQWHMDEHYSCSIWVMKEYGVVDSWTKQFTIDLNMEYWKVLGFWKNDHVLVQKIQPHGLMVFSYDPESQQVKNLGCKSAGFHYADNYVENLVLLDKPDDVVSKEENEQEEEVQSVGCHICLRWCSEIVSSANSALRQKITTIRRRIEGCSRVMWQCVSKSCNSLITSPAFINSSLTRSHSDSNKLIVRYLDVKPHVERYKLIYEDNDNNDSSSEQIQDLEFPLKSNSRDYFRLLGSANGLFGLHEENRFILRNSCIRKFITLPNTSVTGLFPCYLVFGFDLRTDDYKVVRIAYQSVNIRYEGAKPPLVEVYSVNEGSWRETSSGDSCPPRITISNWHPQATSLNGDVYFVANDWGDAQSLIVLSFDLGDEVFRLISLPNGKCGLDADIGTSEFKGLLSLICYESRHMGQRYSCSVWVMKEYGDVDSWTKQFTIELNMLRWTVLGFWKNDHVLVQKMQSDSLMRIQSHGSMLLSYDPESQQVKNLGFYRSTCYSYADNYVRNLTLIDKPNDVVSKRKVSKKRKCR